MDAIAFTIMVAILLMCSATVVDVVDWDWSQLKNAIIAILGWKLNQMEREKSETSGSKNNSNSSSNSVYILLYII